MDRVFVEYYEEELTHIRGLAAEFADMHPAVARNLSLDTVPCPDPYVERLLDGVAFLAARTRLKVDAERSRFSRSVLDVLYPDLVTPAPATAMVVLKPGQQVQTMLDGHVVRRNTRLVSSLRPGLSTRCTFSTAQETTLWPIAITSVSYFQDRSALAAAGMATVGGVRGEAALRITLAPTGKGKLHELTLDRLDIYFAGRTKAPLLFDAIFGTCSTVGARAEGKTNPLSPLPAPEMVGISDDEALMPRTRPTFEGYRLLREYFIMPERFHYVRVSGLQPVVRRCDGGLEIVFQFRRPVPELADLTSADFELFATPIINLFERECNVVEIDARKTRQVLHADRTRARDFEIYRIIRVEDADTEGNDAEIPELFSLGQNSGSGWVYSTERRPRRATEDERRDGLTRTSYTGDDVFLAVSRPLASPAYRPLKRLDVVALCTNRDLPILDDNPTLTLEAGDPVEIVRLLGALRPPQPAIPAALPTGAEGESRADDLAWRLVAQLMLNFLSLAKEGRGVDPLHALLDIYADRGDPSLARNVHSIARIDSRPVVERLQIEGPMCFGRGTEVTLHVDESILAGQSTLLLSALLARLFARYAGINGFVRTRTRLLQKQEDVPWPMTPGNRSLI
ncbi:MULTISPECIES: type VI secretion system baseplate subunit TssF [unclassified Mesorhizobium]|uniref:type VI secretion system baseplate subunit TssF n=1 Tax=unclassified Mesorhizobium TaxID=325217 RepID=UPI0011298938|nr:MULTISPECIES: type VI secretion system baseplate subunit TssF [unclassified Mesorhizobium]MBZ9916625.1 type VI secretion system baseplate subunit TssF [Mesorhizobium sp. BR1-1-7]MBZ9954475.1 type VI secretion system baseplate subunit TssF [Mesorhizobium sp. BR1-1-15]MBZ9971560.1 type VI secretion system baseplate subunit TssF [Mesorhizobium sp. BR1-1-12]TPI52096.1 type VI secretion system baseplate subunit TssF [Mesorhizobium sp. B3-1-1]TPJ64018.1 type VI secretion system baseplate subunit 